MVLPHDADAFARTIDAAVGSRTLNQVLERIGCTQASTCAVDAFPAMAGVQPDDLLTEAEMRRIGFTQLPDEVF